jgi:hypothetical protein
MGDGFTNSQLAVMISMGAVLIGFALSGVLMSLFEKKVDRDSHH